MSAERLFSLATAKGVNFECVSRGGVPEWTLEDIALASHGMPKMLFYAALYSWAGDDSVRPYLKWRLIELLLEEREHQQWATFVEDINGNRVKFAENLVELFLDEERSPAKYRDAPALRAIALRVEGPTWVRTVSHQYACVHSEYARALLDAGDWIKRRVREG